METSPGTPTNYDDIATDLKQHQRQGVEFILKREDPEHSHCTNSHVCAITGANLSAASSMGGIIADPMGMGKTLTVISAIVVTKLDSRNFVAQGTRNSGDYKPGTTLVVLPSAQLMDVWHEEIRKHIKPEGRILVSGFHEPRRAKFADMLLVGRSDIVLTTYATLVEDCKKGEKTGVLQNIFWYRLLLDEAHWIRNQSSKTFKAVKALASDRRWCLTETPVQKSLNDLASLVAFLEIQPFAKAAEFKLRILTPLRNDSNGARCRNLRTLLSSICLRRRSECLGLPRATEELVYVDQTQEEKAERERVKQACRDQMEDLVSNNGSATGVRGGSTQTKKYNIMLDIMLQLRRACNNGTLRPAAANCFGVPTDPAKVTLVEDLDSGLCNQCEGGEAVSSAEDYCSLCCRKISRNRSSKTRTPASEASSGAGDRMPDRPSPTVMEWSGHSSKLERIVQNILQSSPGDKSIVFSSWTSTLNILQHLLELKGIRLLRIDGAVKASERAGIIDTFCVDPAIPVILLTIGCGAVGLTITAANRIHLVEPQWNPSVEEQAIARAVRMGQKREVAVLRYLVRGWVEKSIMDLQKKKRDLAKFTIDGGKDGMYGSFEDLQRADVMSPAMSGAWFFTNEESVLLLMLG